MTEKTESPRWPLERTSRRSFLQAAAGAAAMAQATARAGQSLSKPAPRRILAWVGTYSSPQGPEGAKGRGQGIYVFELNPASGVLTQREIIPNDANPSCLALQPSGAHLYSANEVSNFAGGNSGSVSAYAVDRHRGHLTLLNTVSSEGAGPAHLSVHPSGKYVLVANYAGGNVAVLPIRASGELGSATDVVHHRGAVGPERPHSAPIGNFAISGHDKPHAHMIQADAAGRFVFSSDLGLDRIFIWKFDGEMGKLTPSDPDSVALPPGDGPRHFAFHPGGRWFYSLQEEGSTLVAFDYDSTRGRLTEKQTLSSLPKGFVGTNFTSEVMISADGKFLYAANRLHDSIAWFPISATGTLTFGGEEWTRGDYPRSFNIDPTGNFLYCCNQRGDAVTTFRVNRQTGALTFTGYYTPIGTPSHIVFLT
ncbi:MAG TPA: lactonase family protein [Terriglobia bacterium]|nr:lactonase family protein [Terriglobia bacterium]